MAKKPKVGTVAKVSSPQGIGTGFGAIPADTEVEVLDVVENGTAGVGEHSGDEDVVLLQLEEPGIVLDDDGNPRNGKITRIISLPLSQYDELTTGVN